MEYFGGVNAELPDDDDEETVAEKKAKKDGKELLKKSSFLEWLQGDDKKENDKEKVKSEDKEKAEDEKSEKLDEEEKSLVAEKLVDDRLESVEQELSTTQPESEDEAAALSAAVFLEKLSDKIDGDQELTDEVLDEALTEASVELGLPLEDAEEIEIPENTMSEQEPEQADAEVDPEDNMSTHAQQTASSTTHTPISHAPPTPPTSPAPNVNNVTQSPLHPNPIIGTPLQPTPNFNAINSKKAEEDKHSHIPYVLAGGLLGYLLGRRRGRIKTEKKLLPVQHKLEKQVETLNNKLLSREDSIRKLGSRHRQELTNLNRAQVAEKIRNDRQKKQEKLKVLEQPASPRPERIGKFALLESAPEQSSTSETISDNKIIEIASQIRFQGTTLEQLYKNGRLELKDLREIVQEYLQGKTYEKLIIKDLKPLANEQYENTESTQVKTGSQVSKIADLLPDFSDTNNQYNLKISPPKESHIVSRVAAVSAVVLLVAFLLILLVFYLLNLI